VQRKCLLVTQSGHRLRLPEPFTGFGASISFAAHKVGQIAMAKFSEFVALADAAAPFSSALTDRF
jgi:hypothetical protein